jgi:hypothetical protein
MTTGQIVFGGGEWVQNNISGSPSVENVSGIQPSVVCETKVQ